jgi:hypothetical protein
MIPEYSQKYRNRIMDLIDFPVYLSKWRLNLLDTLTPNKSGSSHLDFNFRKKVYIEEIQGYYK